MTALTTAKEMAALLAEAGIRAVVDPAKAGPPCVLITPPARAYDLPDGYTATWVLYALASPPGDEHAWSDLDRIADAVASVLPVRSVQPTWYIVPSAPESLPAYQLTLIEAPQCQ